MGKKILIIIPLVMIAAISYWVWNQSKINSGYYGVGGNGARNINVLGTLYNQPKGIVWLPVNDSASAIKIQDKLGRQSQIIER